MAKLRKCRNCKRPYVVPSKFPGCCSKACKQIRMKARKDIQEARTASNERFFSSRAWFDVRYRALKMCAGKCMACGNRDQLQVDHIKPRSKFPSLALNIDNLQVLCFACNLGKSNKDCTDWR